MQSLGNFWGFGISELQGKRKLKGLTSSVEARRARLALDGLDDLTSWYGYCRPCAFL